MGPDQAQTRQRIKPPAMQLPTVLRVSLLTLSVINFRALLISFMVNAYK